MASTFTSDGPPPPGVTPDYEHPSETLDSEFIATVVLSMALTTFFTAARLIGRRAMGKFAAEDYLSFTTWFVYMGYVATGILQMQAGIGRHVWDVPASRAPRISQLSWAIELIYCIVTWLAKAALLLQLQRLFSPSGIGSVFVVCRVLIWGNLAFYVSAFIAIACECIPIQRAWDPHVTHGSCIDVGALLLFMAGLNVFSDVLILFVPIWAIYHLHIGTKVKLDVWAFFAPYLFAIAASVCKLVYTVPPLSGGDTTYKFAPVELWSLAELTSIILCTCFPLMPRFFQVVRGSTGRIRSRLGTCCSNCRSRWTCGHDTAITDPHGSDNGTEKQRTIDESDEQRLCIHMEQTVIVESASDRSRGSSTELKFPA